MTPTLFVILSLNTILKLELVFTPVLLSDGDVETITGGVVSMPDAEVVGEGLPDEKSAALLFVSWPVVVLCTEVVLLGAVVGPLPSKQLAPP